MPIREYSPLCLSDGLCWGKTIEVGRGSAPCGPYREEGSNVNTSCWAAPILEEESAEAPAPVLATNRAIAYGRSPC